ncbi:FAD-dependent oxidoreductase [Rhabdobacter roseus]|uniref:NAD(P)H-nitrite reductase large subunit n=1 Tax=Rhabdobacter roseus TaxID=1655419 RepID=A0A840TND1_9BACT|nr:FAD/NAD(P)-binding oxidoreductase [Rhabdobacter roseus]MBB5285786.1 NAD(P)H-nitrite reductase large subunit [Rhabdobacter roseus]
MKHIVILGNGIGGITTARHVRKLSQHRITVVSGETEHFFSRTALMYLYMGHMKYEHIKPYEDFFWAKNRIELRQAWVKSIDFEKKELHFAQSTSEPLGYDILVLATGSTPSYFEWPGQELPGVQGLYSYQDLERMETAAPRGTSRGVVVGGGLIGVEMAEMLLSRDIPVTLLVREKSYWGNVLPREESELVSRHIREHGVDLRFGAELAEIKPDASGQRVGSIKTTSGEEIAGPFVGLATGVRPNVDFLRGTSLEVDRGILVNKYLETNLPDVYALGDCAQHREPPAGRKPVEQIWYTGRIMGETLARTLCGTRTPYTPGVFYNSAKFFDIEYQTYGQVPARLDADTGTFYWEHPEGRIALRINFEKETGAVTGFNACGLRLRHEVCARWIEQQSTLSHVMQHLREAHFDPEFFRRHEPAIAAAFRAAHPAQASSLQGKRSWRERWFSF